MLCFSSCSLALHFASFLYSILPFLLTSFFFLLYPSPFPLVYFLLLFLLLLRPSLFSLSSLPSLCPHSLHSSSLLLLLLSYLAFTCRFHPSPSPPSSSYPSITRRHFLTPRVCPHLSSFALPFLRKRLLAFVFAFVARFTFFPLFWTCHCLASLLLCSLVFLEVIFKSKVSRYFPFSSRYTTFFFFCFTFFAL